MKSLFFLMVFGVALSTASHAEALRKPIQIVAATPVSAAIAKTITGDDANITVLVEGNVSPHHFALRPSQAMRMSRADMVLAIHPDYEFFLRKFAKKHPVVWLSEGGEVSLLPQRPSGGHDHAHHHHAEVGTRLDPHLWLEPDNVSRMGEYLAARLANEFPERAGMWSKHADTLKERMQDLKLRMKDVLAHDKEKKFAAYHDGYQYFENVTGIELGMTFSDAVLHQLRPSALNDLASEVKEHDVRCLVSEPEFNSDIIERLGDAVHLPVMSADPEGMMISERGAAFFERLLLDMARDFHHCLRKPKKS